MRKINLYLFTGMAINALTMKKQQLYWMVASTIAIDTIDTIAL